MQLISTHESTHTHTDTQSVHAIIKFISWRHTDNNNNNSFTQFAWQASGAERGREEKEQCTHSRSTQLSVNSVCPLPSFRSPSISRSLSLSCRLLVDQQGNALESAFISGQASLAPLFFSFFFFLFLLSLLLLLFMIYAHRRTHPIAALLNCFA